MTLHFISFLIFSSPIFILAQMPLPIKLHQDAIAKKKAKIKTITIRGQTEDNDWTLYSIKTFNPQGQLTKEVHHIGRVTIDSYQYNATGMLSFFSKTLENGTILETIAFEYDNNRLLKEKHQSKSNSYSVVYQYNEQGLIDTTFIKNKETELKIWSYNTQQQLSAVRLYSQSEQGTEKKWIQNARKVFYYNKQKLLTKTASCFCRLCFSNVYHYNKKKQLIAILEYQNKELLGKSTISYNKKKLINQKSFDSYTSEDASPTRSNLEIFEYAFY